MKKTTLILILTIICVILAIVLSIAITYRVAVEPMQSQIAKLQRTVDTIKIQNELQETKETAYIEYKAGKDGKTPDCYYEPNQCRGEDGKDSVSTHTEVKNIETIIKEQQVAQPYKDIQFNPATCAIETKMSNERFWEIAVQLNPSVVQCLVSVQVPFKPSTGLVEL